MRLVRQEALGSEVKSSDDIDPYIGVSDGRLMVAQNPLTSGTFTSSGGELPNISAKSFRLSNSSSSNIVVRKRRVLLSKYFDGKNLEVVGDSESIILSNPSIDTPLGSSRVLKVRHTADNSAYSKIDAPFGLAVDQLLRCFFKVESNTTQLQPLGIYSNYGGIDINHPAVGIRVNADNSFVVRIGTTETVVSGTYAPGAWHRATINVLQDAATVSVDAYDGGATQTWTSVFSEASMASSGVGLVSELLTKDSYYVAFAAEASGVQYVDNFEILSGDQGGEYLFPGESKEYECNRTLAEYDTDAPVTGYYRG
jgi:hypothetical protein